MELNHTIHLIEVFTEEIDIIERLIKQIMDADSSSNLTIPRISYRMGAIILAKIRIFARFSSPDQVLANADLSPSTYQSSKLDNAIHTWKSAVHTICTLLCSMLPGSFVNRTRLLQYTWQRNEPKESNTTSPDFTQPRNISDCFSFWLVLVKQNPRQPDVYPLQSLNSLFADAQAAGKASF